MRLDAWGWCTGMTQRDGMGREVEGGVQDGDKKKSFGGYNRIASPEKSLISCECVYRYECIGMCVCL